LAGNPFTQPAVTSVFQLFGRKPVQFSRTRDTCIKCKKRFRVPLKESLDEHRPHTCLRCRKEQT
jgi:hypothetical protein